MAKKPTKYLLVQGCARCGGKHTKIVAKRFINPVQLGNDCWTHWWICPKTKEPGICKLVIEPEAA